MSARPVPSLRAVALLALGLVPAALAIMAPSVVLAALTLDLVIVGAVLVDFARACSPRDVMVAREIDPVLSAFRPSRVRLTLELRPGAHGPLTGRLRDALPEGASGTGHDASFSARHVATIDYQLEPTQRGDLQLDRVWLRLDGPWGLCARQGFVSVPQQVKVFPDLTALTKDALALARVSDDDARRRVPLRSEGREFESLREYRVGDDRRSIDWKATARRSRTMVRVHQPERNQVVLLLLDCGRHMAGVVHGRQKLDHAVDAALRVAKVSLDRGDLVGVMAFGSNVKAWLPPRKGAEHLRGITQTLYRVSASLEESDYGAALDLAFARGVKRSLVTVLTELVDPDAAQALLSRTRKLVPRHLPLIASLLDDELVELATHQPKTVRDAHRRRVAQQLETDARATVTRLRGAGARVLRTSAREFGAAAVNAYLDIKARGLL